MKLGKYKWLLAGFLALISLQARSELRSAKALKTQLGAENFKATLEEGFHFNEKAPNSLTVDDKPVKPSQLSPRKIEFAFGSSVRSLKAQLYVCDDKVTYCETHNLDLKMADKQSAKKQKGSKIARVNENGFIKNNFDAAIEIAKNTNRLLLLDFSARWCPGCVRLKTEVFPTKAFKTAATNIVKAEIDTDIFENFQLADKYKITGIPTLVIVNTEGEEIERLSDYQPVEKINEFILRSLSDPEPISKLIQARDKADPKSKLRVGLRLFNSGKAEESIKYLSQINPTPAELWSAKIQFAHEEFDKDPNKKNDYIATLRSAIEAEKTSTRSVAWRTELVGLLDHKEAETKRIFHEGIKLSSDLLSDSHLLNEGLKTDSVGEFKGFERWVVAFNKADLIEAFDSTPEQVQAAWSEAGKIGSDYKIPVTKKGPALRYLSILSAAKLWKQAEDQVNSMLKNDPTNDDLQRRKLKILVEQKKFSEASFLGEKIIQKAEGRNQFWVAEQLAKSYIAESKYDAAKKLLAEYLAKPEINEKKMKSSKQAMEQALTQTQATKGL